MSARTLFQLAGREPQRAAFPAAVLILIDYQNEYLEGPLRLPAGKPALGHAARLLVAARASGSSIIHVAHKGGPGGMFDRSATRGAIIDALTPAEGETIVEKPRPNAFSGTALAELLRPAQPIIMAGFMTHMCVSSTARAALDLGFPVTLAADACATRDLPNPTGGSVEASIVHMAELAALADRFASIATTAKLLG